MGNTVDYGVDYQFYATRDDNSKLKFSLRTNGRIAILECIYWWTSLVSREDFNYNLRSDHPRNINWHNRSYVIAASNCDDNCFYSFDFPIAKVSSTELQELVNNYLYGEKVLHPNFEHAGVSNIINIIIHDFETEWDKTFYPIT